MLLAWAEKNGIPSPTMLEDFHTTIVYSRVSISDYPVRLSVMHRGWRFAIDHFEMLPTKPGGDKMVLVGVLKAEVLEELHRGLLTLGATHDFPDYIPHISISYEIPVDFDVTALVPPVEDLYPEFIYLEPLDLNWKNT
jgi:hypothetical protein